MFTLTAWVLIKEKVTEQASGTGVEEDLALNHQ